MKHKITFKMFTPGMYFIILNLNGEEKHIGNVRQNDEGKWECGDVVGRSITKVAQRVAEEGGVFK